MPGFLQRLALMFASKQAQSRQIAQVCATSLKEVGLNVGGNVFELKNSRGNRGWLVSLQMPERVQISPVDALALRLFLCKRVEAALKLKPKSMHLVLNFSFEAKRLPFAESVVDPKWIQSRIAFALSGAKSATAPDRPPAAAAAAPAAPKPAGQPAALRANPVAPTTRAAPVPFTPESSLAAAAAITRPVSASAQTQEERLEEMLATFDDDDLYEVNEGSMTDFDRAMK